jgi:hypothetical protein
MWPFKRSSSLMALDAATKELVQARAARMEAQERFLAAIRNLEAGKTITINGADHGEEAFQSEIQVSQRR